MRLHVGSGKDAAFLVIEHRLMELFVEHGQALAEGRTDRAVGLKGALTELNAARRELRGLPSAAWA